MSQDSPDAPEYETVARSLDALEIEVLRGRLQAAGIDAHAFDQGMNTVSALYAIALGGTRLVVPHDQAQRARQIIELVRAGAFELRGEDDPASNPSSA